ncbi:pOTRA domain protein FtsQ-type [Phascolarctobacterium sp. CAG:266]|nr:pOTRA domain protein FtsQ-type [Phascolarctobacterium sp. CAG:266]
MQSTRERLKANRKKRRLRLLRLFFIAAVITGALAGAWRWATSPGTAFGSIVIEGTSQLTQSELLSMCGTQEPVNLFVVSPSAIEKTIAGDVRFEKAETEYHWPGVLVVRVKERIPALYIACSYKGYAQVDYNGVVMSVSDGIKEADAPVLSGVVTGNIFFGDTIKEKNVLEILGFLSKLDKEVTDSISEIAVDGSNNVKFNLRYGYPILLGNADNISDKLDIFITVFNDIKTKNIRAEYIDLTFAKPYIKLRQKA